MLLPRPATGTVPLSGHRPFPRRAGLHRQAQHDRDARFASIIAAYDRSPGDVVTAFAYLMHHPLFHRPQWPSPQRTAAELTAAELGAAPEFVVDDDGLRDLWVHIDRDGDGRVVVLLEHGPHRWPEDVHGSQRQHTPCGGTSSHDPQLDVAADGFEAALVRLAALVRARYGNDRSKLRAPPAG